MKTRITDTARGTGFGPLPELFRTERMLPVAFRYHALSANFRLPIKN